MAEVTGAPGIASTPAWGSGGSRRFLALAAGRAGSQVVSVIWFIAAARLFTDDSFGQMASGLAFFALFAGLGDVGTTRTVVRYIAADESSLWPVYRRALIIRIGGGVVAGAVVTGLVALLPVNTSTSVVALAAVMATASGATELAFSALRSVARVNVEAVMLVFERVLFLGLGLLAIDRGYGPLVILGLYAGTNALSAFIAGVSVYRRRVGGSRGPDRLIDREGLLTAVAFALLVVSPRLAPVVMALIGTAHKVGVFSVGQRPVEAVTLFALSSATPVLPIVRSWLVRGQRERAEHAAVSVAGALAVAMAPIVVWFLVRPSAVVDAFFGDNRYAGGDTVLRFLALTAVTWSFRGVGEFVLLAEERARTFLQISLGGAALTVGVGAVGAVVAGPQGLAAAVLLAEVVMTALLARAVPSLADGRAARAYAPALVVGGTAGAALLLVGHSIAAQLVVVASASVVGATWAITLVRRLDRA